MRRSRREALLLASPTREMTMKKLMIAAALLGAAVDFVKLLALVALVAVFGTLSETPTLLVPECDRPRGGKASVV